MGVLVLKLVVVVVYVVTVEAEEAGAVALNSALITGPSVVTIGSPFSAQVSQR